MLGSGLCPREILEVAASAGRRPREPDLALRLEARLSKSLARGQVKHLKINGAGDLWVDGQVKRGSHRCHQSGPQGG